MQLNNIELSRAAALIDGLRLINETLPFKQGEQPPQLNERQIEGLQTFTIEKGTRYAEVYGVDFPDETLPESLLATLTTRKQGRPSVEEMERLTALAPSYPRTVPAWDDTNDDWSEIEARAEVEAYQ